MATRKMHQTTLRFGAELWETLEREAAELGVSVAQFVRESALARLHYLAGRRGDDEYQRALEQAGAGVPEPDPGPEEALADTLSRSVAEMSESSALWAQGRLARRRAQELRDEIDRKRRVH